MQEYERSRNTEQNSLILNLKKQGWGLIEGSKILREYIITFGKIQSGGGRAKPLIADYILVYKGTKQKPEQNS